MGRALPAGLDLVTLRVEGAEGRTASAPENWGIRAQSERLARELRDGDVLLGHSMGGTLATRIAEQAKALRGLILIEPHVFPRAGFVVRPTLDLGAAPTPEAFAAYLRRFETIDTGQGTYADWIKRWDWRVFHHMSQDLAFGDGGTRAWLDVLRSLRAPVEVIWGGLSDDAGEDEHGRALRDLGFPFHVVEGSRHFIPSEAPEALARTLAGIVAQM